MRLGRGETVEEILASMAEVRPWGRKGRGRGQAMRLRRLDGLGECVGAGEKLGRVQLRCPGKAWQFVLVAFSTPTSFLIFHFFFPVSPPFYAYR
jgi:hypothetical protein